MLKGKSIYLRENKVCEVRDNAVRHKVGDKVICIFPHDGIEKDKVYTVSKVYDDDLLNVVEAKDGFKHCGYYHYRFKKVKYEQVSTTNTNNNLKVLVTATQNAGKQEVFTWEQIKKKPGLYRNARYNDPGYFIIVTGHLQVFYTDKHGSIQVAIPGVHEGNSYVLYDGVVSVNFKNQEN